MKVPYRDPSRVNRAIFPSVAPEVKALLDDPVLIGGQKTYALEQALCTFFGCHHAVTVGSGTVAISLALMAAGVGPGDEVITVGNICAAVPEAILRTGATPVLADIEPDHLTLDPERLEQVLGDSTKAIVPVHLYGFACEMDSIVQVIGNRPIGIVEAAAQAAGATYHERYLGAIGLAGCLSFHPWKLLGGWGAGGAVLTNNQPVAESIRMLTRHGRTSGNLSKVVGYPSRLDDLQATVVMKKLESLHTRIADRAGLARTYIEEFAHESGFQVVYPPKNGSPAFQTFAIRTPYRNQLGRFLSDRDIGTRIHYWPSADAHPAFADRVRVPFPLQVTRQVCDEVLSLPLYEGLAEEEQAFVIESIKLFFKTLRRPLAGTRF